MRPICKVSGHRVTGIDRNPDALAQLPAGIQAVQADIENAAWPLPGQQFDAVVVTNLPVAPPVAAAAGQRARRWRTAL